MDSDWTEIWDESSQRFYYYNTITQLTTWDKPSIIVSIDNDSYNNNDIHRDNNSSNSANGSNDVIESLAWIELYDQDSDKYYYYNKDTNETTWIKPNETASKQSTTTATATIAVSSSSSAATAAAAEIHAQQQQQKSGQQPYNEKNNDVNWHEVMTEDGRIYYYNENTQETSWTIPTPDDVKCSGSSSRSSSSHNNKYNNNGENTDDITTATENNKKNKKKKKKKDSSKESNLIINTDENDLDHHHGHNDDDNHDGWQEMVDESTGMHYFANLLTGMTQWENPWGVNTSINDNYIGGSSSRNSRGRSSCSGSGSGSGGSYDNIRSGNHDMHNNNDDGDENDNNNQNNLSLYDGDELNLLSPLKVPSTTIATIANKNNNNSNDHVTTTYSTSNTTSSTSESNIKNKGSNISSINSNGGSNHHHQSYLSAPVDYSSSLFTKNDKIHLARMSSDSSSSSSSSSGNNGHFAYNAIVRDDNDTHSRNDNDNEAIHAIQYDDNDKSYNNVKNNELTMLYQAILDGINSSSSSTTITAVKASDLILSIPINAYRAQNTFLLHTLLKILNSPSPSSSTSSSTSSSSMFRLEKYAELNFQYDRRNIHHNSSSSSSASNIHPYERMLSYQSDVLKSSLTILSSSSLTNDAIQCFRFILSFIDHTAKVVITNNNNINAARDDITNFIPTFNNITISGSANNDNDNNNADDDDDFRSNYTDSNISNRGSIDIQKMDIVLHLLYKLVNSSSIELHDEIYCQLCKQSIKNPHIESVELLWQLFIIILATIPPSRSILPYLLNHISSSLINIQMKITTATTSISSSSSPPVTTPYDNIKRFIQSSLYHILPSAYATHRHEVPSNEEIRSLLLNGSMDVMMYTLERCDLCYYKCYQLTITSYTTVEEILLMICRKLSIHHNNSNIFALYECCMESEDLSSLSQTSSSSSSLLLSSSNEKILPSQDRILDWIARQQRRHNAIMNRNDHSNSSSCSNGGGGGNDNQDDGNKNRILCFVFKARYIFDTHRHHHHQKQQQNYNLSSSVSSSSFDRSTQQLLYSQAVYDVLTTKYPYSIADGLTLASFLLQDIYGDFMLGCNTLHDLKVKHRSIALYHLLSNSLLASYDNDNNEISTTTATTTTTIGIAVPFTTTAAASTTAAITSNKNNDHTQNQKHHKHNNNNKQFLLFEQKILSLHRHLVGISRDEIKSMYLSYISSWKTYGATFFLVTSQVNSTPYVDIILSISMKCVLLIDPINKHYLVEYSYEQIYSWGYSFDSFVLVIGNKAAQVKSFFKTSEGKDIDHYVNIYYQHNHHNSMICRDGDEVHTYNDDDDNGHAAI